MISIILSAHLYTHVTLLSGVNLCPPLLSAVANNHLECVEYLLSLNCNINVTDANNNNVLHIATELDDPIPMILILLKYNADTEHFNLKGFTPLDLAVITRHVDMINILGGD